MKEIIIIGHEPLTKRIKNIFLIDDFIQRGFPIKYWDMSQYFHSGIKLVDELKEDYIVKVYKLDSLILLLSKQNIKNTLFVVEVFCKFQNRSFFKLLKKNSCYLIQIEMYATANLPVSLFDKLKNADVFDISKALINKIKSLFYDLYLITNGLNIYDLSFTSNPFTARSNNTIQINHPDFELSKSVSKLPRRINQRYAVFIDEYFPLHPDLEYFLGIKPQGEEEYLFSMNSFFKVIEEKYNIKVIIAAHPKSSYNELSFDGREVVKYKTCELVKDSEFVVLHSSAAVSFAILFKKAILFTFTEPYKKCYHLYSNLVYLSKFLEVPAINLDKGNFSFQLNINEKQYENYKYTYLCSKASEVYSNSEILLDVLSVL